MPVVAASRNLGCARFSTPGQTKASTRFYTTWWTVLIIWGFPFSVLADMNLIGVLLSVCSQLVVIRCLLLRESWC